MADPLEGYDPNYYIEPYKAPWCNHVMHGPPGTDVEPLDVCLTKDEHNHVLTASAWQVNDEQRSMLAAGATIRLTVWQHPIPPLALGIEPPWCSECKDHKWFNYLERRFECHCRRDDDAEDDPDAARRAAPKDLLAEFTEHPEAAWPLGDKPRPDGGKTFG